jgi:hypothetical protein
MLLQVTSPIFISRPRCPRRRINTSNTKSHSIAGGMSPPSVPYQQFLTTLTMLYISPTPQAAAWMRRLSGPVDDSGRSDPGIEMDAVGGFWCWCEKCLVRPVVFIRLPSGSIVPTLCLFVLILHVFHLTSYHSSHSLSDFADFILDLNVDISFRR